MEKRKYIKLNTNDDYLSIGNLFRIVKEESNSKNTFLQSELFCSIFNLKDIADSTVNNYLTGFRSINSIYKEKFMNLMKEFEKNTSAFIPIVFEILSRLENKLYKWDSHSLSSSLLIINSNIKLNTVCNRLFNLAKNDKDVSSILIDKLKKSINSGDLYLFIINILSFVVLERTQPVYQDDEISKYTENSLINTNISTNEVRDFLNIALQESMWSSITLTGELAKKGNPFACLQMAFFEFYGLISGYPRYIKSYNYYKIAAEQNHPAALWAIGFMYYNGYIGNKTDNDYTLAYSYFKKAKEHGLAAAINSIGLCYLSGKIPEIDKNVKIAKEMFVLASEKGSVFALNNLGVLSEDENDFKNAFLFFKKSADLGESWAANKVGEYYRKGLYVKKDMKLAFYYYLKSDEKSTYFMCPWSKYNLAYYFYKNGNADANVEANLTHAINLLTVASNSIVEASEELIYIYYKKYLDSNKKDLSALEKVKIFISKVESSPKFTAEIKSKIEKIMGDIYSNKINFLD